MAQFRLSGFADEIDPDIDRQIQALKRLNINSIELRGVNGTNISELTLEQTTKLKEKLDQEKITVSAIGSPLGKISINDDFESHLALFDHVILQAKILETKYIRIFSFYDATDEDRQEVLERLGLFLSHTPDTITLLHENEKGIYGNTAPRCLDILQHFGSIKLRATFDPANLIQEGQRIDESFEMLLPYIEYVHAKDALFSSDPNQLAAVVPCGMGDGQWPYLIRRLEETGYHGYLSLEPHLAEFEGFDALEQGERLASVDFVKQLDGEGRFELAAGSLRKLLTKENS